MAPEVSAVDDKMASAKVTPDQLKNANEPTFSAAADAHEKAKTESEALPDKVRTQEGKVLDDTKANAVGATDKGLGAMFGQRSDQLAATTDKQTEGKAKYEETRARISKQLGDVYAATEKSVNERMAKLDKDVDKTFDDGASSAKTRFYIFLAEKLLIYYASGSFITEAILGGNTKEKIFADAQREFEKDLLKVIDDVADVVEAGLNEVVAIIAAGKASLDDVVAKMDPADKSVADQVATDIRNQFAQLEKSVEDKQTQIIESVSKKYVAAQKEVESTVNLLRDPVGALIDVVKEQVGGIIDTIINLKNMLLGILAKASEAIDLIIKDPIGFLGNLVNGVKQGVLNFMGKIGTYLQKGLLEWLFGALAGAGIQMPEKFDLSGLLSIVLQVLGLTWANIRQRAVAIVGEKVVKTLETGSEIIITLVTKGPAGLWEYIKEQAASMMETVKEGVKSFVIESVVVAGVKWLIGLLNPASAFVKACMAIYDVVMFIINRGKQIMDFVNAVLDSVISIAKGSIGVAATAVEAALARSLPVAIGFLASLLGIGDLSAKIKKVIDKIQAPINKVIDWLIKKAVGLVKAVGKMLGFGGKEENKKEAGKQDVDLHCSKPVAMSGEQHEVIITSKGDEVSIELASKNPRTLKGLVASLRSKISKSEGLDKVQKNKLHAELSVIAEGVLTAEKKVKNRIGEAMTEGGVRIGLQDAIDIANQMAEFLAGYLFAFAEKNHFHDLEFDPKDEDDDREKTMSVWDLGNDYRGLIWEDATGGNLKDKTIAADRVSKDGKTATSIKSMNRDFFKEGIVMEIVGTGRKYVRKIAALHEEKVMTKLKGKNPRLEIVSKPRLELHMIFPAAAKRNIGVYNAIQIIKDYGETHTPKVTVFVTFG